MRLKVDVIVAAGSEPPALAAKEATQDIPIVMVNVGDPVGTGLVSSLGHPGGNVTELPRRRPTRRRGRRKNTVSDLLIPVIRFVISICFGLVKSSVLRLALRTYPLDA